MKDKKNCEKGSRSEIVFDERFRGPFPLIQGGYVSGTMATYLESDTAEVTMRGPAPVGRRLILDTGTPHRVFLYEGDELLSEARPAELDLDLPKSITIDEARKASLRHVTEMPYPDCFGCGSARSEDDGLHLRAGPVEDRSLVAIDWVPRAAAVGAREDREVPEPVIWAGVECVVIRAMQYGGLLAPEELVLLGRMTAKVQARPAVGQPYFFMAWPLGREGRKITLGGTLHDEAGGVLVLSQLVFITLKESVANDPAVKSRT
jgi:hypothetical protein